MIWQITTIDDDQTIFHIAIKKHLPAKTSTFSTTLLFGIQNQLVFCVVHHLINIILIKSIRAIVTMSQASTSWKWHWQVILPSLTVISALVGAPPPATQLFPIVLKPRYAHFISTSIIILVVPSCYFDSGDSIREQTTCTVRPANASSYLCLICVLVLPNLLSLSVPPNNCKKTNATNRTIKKDYPPQIPSYYSTSNVSLVCCQRYIEANWH